MYDLVTPGERRLRGALSSSFVLMPAALVGLSLLRRPIHNDAAALVAFTLSLILSLGSVAATWGLVAVLLEHRPAWHPLRIRLIWLWTLAACLTLALAGWLGKDSNTLGAVALYGAGMMCLASAAVGLTLALIPVRRDATGE
jgi:hypothetical protein